MGGWGGVAWVSEGGGVGAARLGSSWWPAVPPACCWVLRGVMREVGAKGGSQHRPSQSCGLQQRSAADLPALLCKHREGCTRVHAAAQLPAQNNVLMTPCLGSSGKHAWQPLWSPSIKQGLAKKTTGPFGAVHATYHQLRAVSDCELPLTDEMPA